MQKKAPDQALLDLIVPRCELGFYYHNADYVTNSDRILYLKEEYFHPGDVMIEMHGANLQRYRYPESMSINIYIGGGKVVTYSAEGVALNPFAETFGIATKNNYAAVLRPMNTVDR